MAALVRRCHHSIAVYDVKSFMRLSSRWQNIASTKVASTLLRQAFNDSSCRKYYHSAAISEQVTHLSKYRALSNNKQIFLSKAFQNTQNLAYSTQQPPNKSSSDKQDVPKPAAQEQSPLKQRIANAQEQAKSVTDKLRSSVSNLRPRENIYNLPNLLTVSRLFAAPLTAYLLIHDQHAWAVAVFAYAGITDLVDGWLARRWKLQTVAGSVIDPMADKALMIILTVTMAVKGALPAYLATLILGRDASLALAAIYYRYASLPAPKTMARYWDFSLPSAEVHPTTVSKYNTFLQLILIGSTLALPVVTADNHHLNILSDLNLGWLDIHQALLILQVIVAGTTAWSGLSYAVLKDAVTILGPDEVLKAKQGARGRAIIGVSFGAIVVAAAVLALLPTNEKSDDSTEDQLDTKVAK